MDKSIASKKINRIENNIIRINVKNRNNWKPEVKKPKTFRIFADNQPLPDEVNYL